MLTLIVVGFLAGVITSISPCVLPVLPVVLTATTSRLGDDGEPVRTGRFGSRRAYGIVGGLVISFSLATLFGSLILSALHLPQDFLRDAGIAVLVLIGLSLIVEPLGRLIERPFARIRGPQVKPDSNGIVLGLGLGLLFVPCAGPVLAAIAVVGATHHVGFRAIVLTAAYGVGAGLPLLILALAGDAITRRTSALRRRARALRISAGVVMIVVAALIGLNLTDGLQRNVPGYTTALQKSVEQNSAAAKQLHAVTAQKTTGPGAVSSEACNPGADTLQNCGPAPEFTGLTGWLNTPGDSPITLASLRGKVVLIDFWTYSCINCQRSLPHVEAWYQTYQKDGLEVIGVHTPEFAFEHVVSNVNAQAHALGVDYPIAIDNNYATWNAYSNQYWPAEYLIDAQGIVRHISYGEGDYSGTEQAIRELLAAAKTSNAALPDATDVPDKTPTEAETTETYLGYKYAPLHVTDEQPVQDKAANYSFPTSLESDAFGLSGTWTDGSEALLAGANAKLELSYLAHTVYLVIGGRGSVTVVVNGTSTTVAVNGVPKLYQLANSAGLDRSVMTLTFTPGLQAYDFTFG
jgi:cytochrome c biogenesis protein CcdA/thiol-disulfide isomerase/thioredoxin